MNAIPQSEIQNVLCCYRDFTTGDSKIVKLGNLPRYREIATRDSLGELVVSDFLNTVLKDPISYEQHLIEQDKWLQDIQNSVKKEY